LFLDFDCVSTELVRRGAAALDCASKAVMRPDFFLKRVVETPEVLPRQDLTGREVAPRLRPSRKSRRASCSVPVDSRTSRLGFRKNRHRKNVSMHRLFVGVPHHIQYPATYIQACPFLHVV